MELVLVRHGRTAWNASKRFMGRSDIPLDDVGLAQAQTLREHPHLQGADAVWASPLSRAAQTASAFSDAVRTHPDLAELNQGELEGMGFPEAFEQYGSFFQAWVTDPTGVVVPGGESLDACRDRAWAALQEIVASHHGARRVVVVSHQMVISTVSALVAGEPLGAWRRYAVDHVAVRRFTVAESGWSLVDAP